MACAAEEEGEQQIPHTEGGNPPSYIRVELAANLDLAEIAKGMEEMAIELGLNVAEFQEKRKRSGHKLDPRGQHLNMMNFEVHVLHAKQALWRKARTLVAC